MSSDSDWSLGVLVFALFALHLSSLADFASSEPTTLFDEAELASKIESDERFRVALSELAERLKVDRFELARKIYSSPSLDVDCNETGTEMLLLKFTYLPNRSDREGLKLQLGRCFSQLDSKIERELESLDKFERREFESLKDASRGYTFEDIDTAISMLRTLADKSELPAPYKHLTADKHLAVCKKMTDKFKWLKPVLAKCGRDAIELSKDKNNIRLYHFCHQLIYGQPDDDNSILADGSVRQFLNILDERRVRLETMGSSEKRQWVAMAIVRVAGKNEAKDLDENILNDVRQACKSAVDRKKRWAWLLDIKSFRKNPLSALAAYTDSPSEECYLRHILACESLIGMDEKTILTQAKRTILILVRRRASPSISTGLISREAIEKEDTERQSDVKKSKPVAKRRCNWSIMGCFGP
jgi:hypothetical protein